MDSDVQLADRHGLAYPNHDYAIACYIPKINHRAPAELDR